MHCISLIAEHSPNIVKPILVQLKKIIDSDESIIVRDYAIDTVGNYAKTGKDAAQIAFPILEHSTMIRDTQNKRLKDCKTF